MSAACKDMKSCFLTDEALERDNRFTPDYLKLKLQKYVPLFVYGEMKVGCPAFAQIKGSIYLGEARTTTQNFYMETADDNNQPVVFETNGPTTIGRHILGDVFLVDPYQMLNLDYIQQNSVAYNRKERFCYLMEQTVPSKTRFKPSLKCFIYLGDPTYWDQVETSTMKTIEIDNNQRAYNWEPVPITDATEDLVSELPNWRPGLMEKYEESRFNGQLPF